MTVRRLATVAIVVLAIAPALAGCGGSSKGDAEATTPATQSTAPDEVGLTDLTSVEQLRAAFNEDRGTARLLLLLSPT